jgi:aminoglycoside phosphotransferase family enzyme/predicted kinase
MNRDTKTCEMTGDHGAVAAWLTSPNVYQHRPDRVEHIETHISNVFLAGSYVYKLKKPVRYDFLDFTTLAAREHACREEVRLNRRLAPDTYLRVAPIVRSPEGRLRWDGAGEIVDWVVEMRRLPTELTLDALYNRGQLHPFHIDRLTTTLVSFYRSLSPLSLTSEEYRERYLAHVCANARDLLAVRHRLPRGAVKRASGFQFQLLSLRPELLENRVLEGRIVDGHGDLRPEHICLSDPIAIFDCIEFSPDFRRIDVADEIAFLTAECDLLGAKWVGPRLLTNYQQQTGDHPPRILTDFYKSYRACVRAKVAALRADQLQGSLRLAAVAEAIERLGFADTYSAPWLRPLVIVVGGLAGTGKTTLAATLADILGAELLRTDIIRQDLFNAGTTAETADGGIYSPDARQVVYEEMFHRGAALHGDRISIILDGTFSTVTSFDRAKKLAIDPISVFVGVECVCRPEVAHQRISQRLAEGRDASQARPEIHDFQRMRWEAWPAVAEQVRIDTERPLAEQVQRVTAKLKQLIR